MRKDAVTLAAAYLLVLVARSEFGVADKSQPTDPVTEKLAQPICPISIHAWASFWGDMAERPAGAHPTRGIEKLIEYKTYLQAFRHNSPSSLLK